MIVSIRANVHTANTFGCEQCMDTIYLPTESLCVKSSYPHNEGGSPHMIKSIGRPIDEVERVGGGRGGTMWTQEQI